MNGGSIARVLAFCQGLRREYSLTVATRRLGSSLTLGSKFMGRLRFSVGVRRRRPYLSAQSQKKAKWGWLAVAGFSLLSLLSQLRYGQMAISLAPATVNRPPGGSRW